MANLRDIGRRMSSIKSTMQVTRTMEMISTARIRAALDRAEQAAPYKEAMTRMLATVASEGRRLNHVLLESRDKISTVLYVVIASDRGLAGGFNVTPERAIDKEIKQLSASGIQCELITCGRKPTEFFTERGPHPIMSFVGISAEPNMDEADRIASYVMEGFERGRIDKVMLSYWHAKNRMDQQLVFEQLLPIGHEQLIMPNSPRAHEALTTVSYQQSDFEFEPSASEVLSYLLPAYVRTVIFHALLDSAAAEHGARRRAMQSATDSAEDMLAQLSRTYNRIRQTSITTELNEIIGGASALEEQV